MESSFDHLKKTWEELSERVERQEKITTEVILKMAHEKSRNKLNKLILIELLGICWEVAVAFWILLNYHELDTPVSLAGALMTIFVIGLDVAMGINFIRRTQKIDILRNNFKETLENFNSWKKIYYYNKIIGYGLGAAVLITVAPFVFRVNRKEEITELPLTDLFTYALFCVVGFFVLSYILYNFYYKKQIRQIDQILADLNNNQS